MSFKHPDFLYLLFAILIPIIIHLFNFRRYKKIMFSNIEFLKHITTQTKKQNKLKHLIVLLMRIMAIIFIVLAFTGPDFSNTKTDTESQPLSFIYIDNSFSMMAEGENGRLFDETIEVARELVNSSSKETQFALLKNEPGSLRLLNKEAAQSEIDDVRISPSKRNISTILRNAQRFASEKNRDDFDLYLLSDFQKNSFDLDNYSVDSIGEYLFVPFLHLQKRNIFIDSTWTVEPVVMKGKSLKISIRIQNASETSVEKIPLKLSINGKQKAVAGVDIPATSFKDINVSVTPGQNGWQLGLVEIEDYPITFDDKYFFSFFVSNRIKVLEIYDQKPSDVIQEFYQSDSIFEFSSINSRQVNYNKLSEHRLIILNSLSSMSSGLIKQITEFAEQGGNVLFIPHAGDDFGNQNLLLKAFNAGKLVALDTSQTKVVSIKSKHKLFKDAIVEIPENANLPIVFSHFKYNYPISSALESLVSLLNGDDFLLGKHSGNGQLFMLASPLGQSFSNFPTHPLFVPIMYGIATQQRIQQRMAYTIGLDNQLETVMSSASSSETPYSLKEIGTDYSFIPEQKLSGGTLIMNTHEGIPASGFYQLKRNEDSYDVFAFNFNRDESVMEFVEPDELEAQINKSGLAYFKIIKNISGDYSKVVESMQKESEIWKLFIIFALLMLLAEVLILRFWK